MSRPIFDQPYGLKYQVGGIQMQLSWRPDFGAEKTAALQKAQYAFSQEAARLIDPFVPFDTGTLKNSVNQASKFDEGLLVYNTPYARKQYYLHAQGSDLRGDTGLRGSYWGQRAIAAHKDELERFARNAVQENLGGGT
nr:MAG TPA: Minor capsid protein [Caudoviricetes sp.]